MKNKNYNIITIHDNCEEKENNVRTKFAQKLFEQNFMGFKTQPECIIIRNRTSYEAVLCAFLNICVDNYKTYVQTLCTFSVTDRLFHFKIL